MDTKIIILIAIIVLCCCCSSSIAGFFIYQNNSGTTSSGTTPPSSTPSSTPPSSTPPSSTPPSSTPPSSTPPSTIEFRPIKADAGGRCIDIPNGSTDNGTVLQMYDCNGTDAQKWMYDSGSKAFKNAFGKCLDVAYGDKNGAIQQYDCNGTKAQQWTTDSDHRIISGLDNSLCLNITGGVGNQGDKLILYSCNENGANEHFNFA